MSEGANDLRPWGGSIVQGRCGCIDTDIYKCSRPTDFFAYSESSCYFAGEIDCRGRLFNIREGGSFRWFTAEPR